MTDYNSETRTCVSGSSEPMLVAPSLTTSVSCVMVLAEDWAAWASLSWLDAAPDTSSLVSSTKALAVFNMFSLKCAETNTLQITQWDTQDYADINKTNLWNFMYVMLKLLCSTRSHLWSAKDSSFSAFSVPAEANMMVVSRSAMMPETELAAVMQAWVPLLPACRADNTRDTCRREWITLHYKLHRRSWDSFPSPFLGR